MKKKPNKPNKPNARNTNKKKSKLKTKDRKPHYQYEPIPKPQKPPDNENTIKEIMELEPYELKQTIGTIIEIAIIDQNLDLIDMIKKQAQQIAKICHSTKDKILQIINDTIKHTTGIITETTQQEAQTQSNYDMLIMHIEDENDHEQKTVWGEEFKETKIKTPNNRRPKHKAKYRLGIQYMKTNG